MADDRQSDMAVPAGCSRLVARQLLIKPVGTVVISVPSVLSQPEDQGPQVIYGRT